jgi:hypothetical protein
VIFRVRSGLFAVSVILASRPTAAFADDLGGHLAALARASVRPAECGGTTTGSAGRWARAREPRLGPYCDALARGYALVGTLPKDALALARRAEEVYPGRAPALLLEARALVALGDHVTAWSRFERVASSGVQVDAPSILHAMAISAVRTRHAEPAMTAYRALVSRVELVDDTAEQERILIEASLLAMTLGRDHVAEAVGYLSEARRRPRIPGLSDYLLSALAMALDRQGLADEASGVAAEASGPWRLESDRERIGNAPELPEIPAGELDAMIAILAEHHDRDIAIERWQSYLESEAGKSGPFSAWARGRLDAFLGKAKKRRPHP